MIAANEAGAWYDKSWCYVSSACDDLNGGSPIDGTQVAYKFTQSGKDTNLRDFSVPESEAVARKSGVDFGMFPAAMGYMDNIATAWKDLNEDGLDEYIQLSYTTTVVLNPPNHQDRLIIHKGECFNSPEMPAGVGGYNP